MNDRAVRLRLIRRRDDRVVSKWSAAIRPDDGDALTEQFLTGVQLATGASGARVPLHDYRLELFAVVGGWTRVKVGGRDAKS